MYLGCEFLQEKAYPDAQQQHLVALKARRNRLTMGGGGLRAFFGVKDGDEEFGFFLLDAITASCA